MSISRIQRKVWLGLAVSIGLLASSEVRAECANDMECKGDRVCEAGACVDPSPASTEGATSSSPSVAGDLSEVQRLELSQARSKAITGLVLGGGTLVMGLATTVTNGEGTAPRVLGGLTLGLGGVATPIAGSGGSQARRLGRAQGLDMGPSRNAITAWGGYGLCMALGTGVFAAGLTDLDISNGLILSLTALGSLSAATMSLDTLSTIEEVEAASETAAARPAFRPEARLAASVSSEGSMLGLVGRF